MILFLQSAVIARNVDETKCSVLSDGPRLSFSKEEVGGMENRQVAAGERTEFTCRVVGAPLANIRWKVRIVVTLDNSTTAEFIRSEAIYVCACSRSDTVTWQSLQWPRA
jgi:hypothetical protein